MRCRACVCGDGTFVLHLFCGKFFGWKIKSDVESAHTERERQLGEDERGESEVKYSSADKLNAIVNHI